MAGVAENEIVGAGCVTVTVAVFVVVPPGPVAVSVYVVVEAGLTLVFPETGLLPTPLSMETVVAFVVDHVSVDDWPAMIDVGDAEKVAVGAGVEFTVTVVCADGGTEFAVVNALSVYVVVDAGVTGADPFAGFEPTPLSMLTLVTEPPPVVQDSVDDDPGDTLLGLAVNDVMQPPPISNFSEKLPKSRSVQVPPTFSSSTRATL